MPAYLASSFSLTAFLPQAFQNNAFQIYGYSNNLAKVSVIEVAADRDAFTGIIESLTPEYTASVTIVEISPVSATISIIELN